MNENEWTTRKTRIDKQLRALNPSWEIIPYTKDIDTTLLTNHAVEEYPTANGPADYALFVKGQLYGIIEAKKVTTDPQNVLEQAKRYASGLPDSIGTWNNFKAPFLYATNGVQIWFADVRQNIYYERSISNFHTPLALQELFSRQLDESKQWFIDNPNDIKRLRPYQKAAIEAIETGIIEDRRNMMLAMATGTGKTFTTVSMVYRLIKSGFAKRILFLVDRRSLAAQAAVEFAAFQTPSGNKFNQEYEVFSQRFQKEDFEDNDSFNISVLPNSYLTSPDNSNTFVYICTIQRMAINLFGRENSFVQSADEPDLEPDAETLNIPVHAFDIIIADECHRGYTARDTGVWRNTLNHFDSLKIGLTATPAAHTVAFFGYPVFRYSIEQGILDGYLVGYEAVRISSDVRINGIFLREGEQVGLKDTLTGQEKIDALEDEREFNTQDVEEKITSPDSNRKIIEEIAGYALQHEEKTGHFPKTLIFAVNDIAHKSHADWLVKIAREVFGRGDDFVQKITGNPSVDRPLQKIREFRNRPQPAIVVTVDMLSTGVDIPALEYIVFLRPVKSRILWTQMLGRGTRKCDDINKECFTVFDCFGGTLINYFRDTTDFDVVFDDQGETVTIQQIIENIWNNVEPDYNKNRLIKRLRRIADTMSSKAREDFSKFIPEGDMASFAGALKDNLRQRFMETMNILRNKDFQDLLHSYDRARPPFYIAYGTQDTVTSEYIFKVGDEQLKPQDYLTAFTEFVKTNKDKIEALSILLNNPYHWSTRVLSELRKVLILNYFPEDKLQKAHEKAGHKALADIISLIKNANDQANPLFTAEERVNRTMQELYQSHNFNPEQKKWLEYIKYHLITNLAIEQENFDLVPVLEDHGGLARARKVFGTELDKLITEINLKLTA